MRLLYFLILVSAVTFCSPYKIVLWEIQAMMVDRGPAEELRIKLEEAIDQSALFTRIDNEELSRKWYENHKEPLPRCTDAECYQNLFSEEKIHWILNTEIIRNANFYLVEFTLFRNGLEKEIYRENYQVPRNPPFAFDSLSLFVVRRFFGANIGQNTLPQDLFLKPAESFQSPWFTLFTTALAGGISYWQSSPRSFTEENTITPTQELPSSYSPFPGVLHRPAPTARSLAMGRTGVATTEDASAVEWNPANLPLLTQTQWQLLRETEGASSPTLKGAYKASLSKYLAYGFSFSNQREDLLKFWSFYSGWGWQLEQIHNLLYGNSLGLSLKTYGVKVGSTCIGNECVRGGIFGWGLDIAWTSLISPGILLGVVWQDFLHFQSNENARTKETYSTNSPSTLRVGAKLESWREWTFSADLDLLSYRENLYRVGAGVEKKWGWIFFRMGMEQMHTALFDLQTGSAGLGMQFQRKAWQVGVNYAYALPLGEDSYSAGTQIFDLTWSY